MFTHPQVKRLNRLTWNLKHKLLSGQVTGVIHKKGTFSSRRNFSIFFPSSNKKTLIDKFKFDIFKTHKQFNIIQFIKYIRNSAIRKSIFLVFKFLNSLPLSEMPANLLTLKIQCINMLLRNLNTKKKKLCNGTIVDIFYKLCYIKLYVG